MLRPSIFGESLLDDWMEDPFEDDFFGTKNALYGKHAKNMMKTDVKEQENGYEVDVSLPGFKKDEIELSLDHGYLSISATKGLDKEEKDKKGKYIHRESYAGSMNRTFYVGDAITEEDIHAKYENGILSLAIPKKEERIVEHNKRIAIEG